MEVLKEKLGSLTLGKVLDVGCGRGEFIDVLKEANDSYSKIIGIDYEDRMLEMAQEVVDSPKIELLKMDGAQLTFEDQSFNTVCISNTLHHLPEIEDTLKEMVRVLKPGGLFIVNEMVCDNQKNPQMSHVYIHHLGAEVDTLMDRTHNRTYRKQEILELVESIGLDIKETLEYVYSDEVTTDKERIEEIIQNVDKKIATIKDHPQYQSLINQGKLCQAWLREHGISGATELMVFARKQTY